MYKETSFFVIASLLVLGIFSFSPITRVFVNEPLSRTEPEVFVVLTNPTNYDYENTRVRIYMDDTDVMLYSNSFELKHKSSTLKRMWGTLSGIEPGLHYMRISVSGKVRDVRYMPVLVY